MWRLFPEKFDAEERPKGWTTTTLTEIADLNPESWGARDHPADVLYVDLANTKWGAIVSTERHPWASAPSRARRVLRAGDTIVGTVRPGNGSYALIVQKGLTGSTGFAVLRPKAPKYNELVYCAATSRQNIDRLAHLADGAAYPAVRPGVVAATAVTLPSPDIIDAFSKSCAPLFRKREVNYRENHTLAELRDFLIPRLMAGEADARDIEQAVERVI